jgi:hypothetical protein
MSGSVNLCSAEDLLEKQAVALILPFCSPGDGESPATAGADGGLLQCKLHRAVIN